MTTFQDPPPQSRRAVRQSERGETSEPQTPTQAPFPSTTDMWDTTARRAAQLPSAASRADAPASVSGRRAASAAATPPATAEPLTYSTQGRPTTPAAPEAPLFRPRGSASAAAPVHDSAALAQPEQSNYRVRDFSPEGRRSSGAPWPEPLVEPAPPSDLDYHTEARLHYEVPVVPISHVPEYIAQPVAPAPAPEPVVTLLRPSAPGVPTEQTLTRRELRALQQAEQAGAGVQIDQPFDFVQSFPPAPEPVADTALTNAITEFDLLTQEPPEAHAATESAPWTPPLGHWSVQAGLDDAQPFENTINRTVGSGSATTSALVLPMIPEGSDIRGPLTSTGEIMLTGSIDLPHTLSSTGVTARFDHEGIDALFDAGDAEVISTDSAPVRAIKAVSTHNSGQGVIHTHKPKGTRALTALLIAASSMAVVVAGLLIVAFALNVF